MATECGQAGRLREEDGANATAAACYHIARENVPCKQCHPSSRAPAIEHASPCILRITSAVVPGSADGSSRNLTKLTRSPPASAPHPP